MRQRSLDLPLPRRSSVKPFLWLVWAMGSCALLAFSSWVLISEFKIEPTQVFKGRFSDDSARLPIVLPAGIPISAFLVSNHDIVEKGQRLARYDVTSLKAQLIVLEQSLHANETKRACLLDASASRSDTIQTPREAPEGERDPNPKSNPSVSLHIEAAMASCLNTGRLIRLDLERQILRLKNLRRKTALAMSELFERSSLANTPYDKILHLRAAHEFEGLKDEISQRALEIAKLREEAKSKVLRLVSALEKEAEETTALIERIKAAIASPWLYAPQAGRVEQLLVPANEMLQQADLVIGKIYYQSHETYLAYLDQPVPEMAPLALGEQVEVNFLGPDKKKSTLVGQVKGVRKLAGSDGEAWSFTFAIPPDDVRMELKEELRKLSADTTSTFEFQRPATALSHKLLESANLVLGKL